MPADFEGSGSFNAYADIFAWLAGALAGQVFKGQAGTFGARSVSIRSSRGSDILF
jgi:hypothetical protein